MYKLKSIFTASIATLLIGINIPIKSARAGMFLSPMYLRMESKQGQGKGVLQIGNTSSKPIRVRLSATPFTYDNNGNFKRRNTSELTNSSPNDLTPYLRYSPQEIVIPANSSRRVRLISLLPPSLPEGEYRTAIFAETLQSGNARGQKIGFNISIGSALYVEKGDLEADIDITQADFNNQQIELAIANRGTATARGKINWTLKQEGKTIDSGESGGSFLPNSKSDIVLNRVGDKKLDLATGTYQLEGEIVWERSDGQKASSFDFEMKL